jgi:hypothetical protein
MRRLAVAADPAAGGAVARDLAARFADDAIVLRSALDFFDKAALTADAANAAAALLALAPSDPAVIGRCLHALRADGRAEQASTAATRALDAARKAALDRPGVAEAVGLLPELSAYYDGGEQQQWLPYIMVGGRACERGAVLNTDARGFRYTVLPDGARLSLGDDSGALGNAVVVGGSTVFGVGASSDAHTLPSLLSNARWRYHNMGARAYVLAQNTVSALLELSRLRSVRRIILLAGWNDIAVLARADVVPRGFGAFFSWNVFCRSFNKIVTHFPEEDWPEGVRARYSTAADRDGDIAHAEAMETTGSMLAAWRMFADHLGAELHYVLQPARDWMDRTPPAAEEEVCALVGGGAALEETARIAAWARPWYADALRDICASHGIPFLDANRLMERHPLRDEWLFVDAAHLTDLGHRVLAEVLTKELDDDR